MKTQISKIFNLIGTTAALSVVLGASSIITPATAANTDPCVPLFASGLKPNSARLIENGQTMRFFFDGYVNNRENRVYEGRNGGRRAAKASWYVKDGHGKYLAASATEITKYLPPNTGKYRLSISNPLDYPAVRSSGKNFITFVATVANPQCKSNDPRRLTTTEYRYDLNPVYNGGKAKLDGRPKLSYTGPSRSGNPTHTPRPRGVSPTQARIGTRTN